MKTLAEIEKIKDEMIFTLNNSEIEDACPSCYEDGFNLAISLMLEREEVAIDALNFYASSWGKHYGFSDSTNEVIQRTLNSTRRTAQEALEKLK